MHNPLFECGPGLRTGAGADVLQFVKEKFDASLKCGVLAHGFLGMSCGDCGRDKLVAVTRKQRGFCASCGVRRMVQTAAYLWRT